MGYRYFICDVFTETRFGGNQLAVLPEAQGLSSQQMQQIAREFNFSETTFVLPAEAGNTNRIRIFTPTDELPFAGHPNIGTAFVLATSGALGKDHDFREPGASTSVVFEEGAGLVPIEIVRRPDGPVFCELAAPGKFDLGESLSAETFAEAISLGPDDIVTSTHPPQVASIGFPFLFVELASRKALEEVRILVDPFEALVGRGYPGGVHFYVRSGDEFDLRARMLGTLLDGREDPATGSANCTLAGLLSHFESAPDGEFNWRIAQGVEMGRPSILAARAAKSGGSVTDTWIGGVTVMVSEGVIEVGD